MGCLPGGDQRHGRSHQHRNCAVDAGRGRRQELRARQGAADDCRQVGACAQAMTRHVDGYRAPAWLPGGHLQTIYPAFLARPPIAYRRERVDTPDGDFVDFDWVDGAADAPLVVLFHGLEGSSTSHYAAALMAHLRT